MEEETEVQVKMALLKEWFYDRFKSGAFATWIASLKGPNESAVECVERIYAKLESGGLR